MSRDVPDAILKDVKAAAEAYYSVRFTAENSC